MSHEKTIKSFQLPPCHFIPGSQLLYPSVLKQLAISLTSLLSIGILLLLFSDPGQERHSATSCSNIPYDLRWHLTADVWTYPFPFVLLALLTCPKLLGLGIYNGQILLTSLFTNENYGSSNISGYCLLAAWSPGFLTQSFYMLHLSQLFCHFIWCKVLYSTTS
jgi:hypothetical protein